MRIVLAIRTHEKKDGNELKRNEWEACPVPVIRGVCQSLPISSDPLRALGAFL
jgi:hypothetical protein